MTALIRSELLRLRTTRVTWGLLAAALVLTLGWEAVVLSGIGGIDAPASRRSRRWTARPTNASTSLSRSVRCFSPGSCRGCAASGRRADSAISRRVGAGRCSTTGPRG
jgi:hypothetical protein